MRGQSMFSHPHPCPLPLAGEGVIPNILLMHNNAQLIPANLHLLRVLDIREQPTFNCERVLTTCMLTKHSILGLSDLISQEDFFHLFVINEVSRITVNHKPSTFQNIPSISQTQSQSYILFDK